MRGRRPGNVRVGREELRTKTRALTAGMNTPAWVDLNQLDQRGWSYGVATSPNYLPLYGTGLKALDPILLKCEAGRACRPELQVEAAREQGNPFTDGPMVRLLQWTPAIDGLGLELKAERVGHWRQAATSRLLLEDDGQLRRRWAIDPRELENPMVCGCLGVEVAIVTSDEQLVLARRGSRSADYRGQTVVSIGEALHPDLDASPTDPTIIDPWAAVTRGVEEELGLRVDGRRTSFTALGLELRRMDPDFLGLLRIDASRDDVQGAFNASLARDKWEINTLDFVGFEPVAVAELLRHDKTLTPATHVSLVFALLQEFEEKDVATTLRS